MLSLLEKHHGYLSTVRGGADDREYLGVQLRDPYARSKTGKGEG